MSTTGTYVVRDGQVVKVSDKVGSRRFLTCTCPSGGYRSENLECFVESRRHKRELLDERGLEETG